MTVSLFQSLPRETSSQENLFSLTTGFYLSTSTLKVSYEIKNRHFFLHETMTKTSPVPSSNSSPRAKGISVNRVSKAKMHFAAQPSSSSCNGSSSPSSPADIMVAEEMQELLSKLKDLVPNMPKNKKLSKLEIIQYVIDYIFDLETALESHPSVAVMAGQLASSFQNQRTSAPSSCSSVRQPLSTLPCPSATGVTTYDFN